jgi:hypothetical protein
MTAASFAFEGAHLLFICHKLHRNQNRQLYNCTIKLQDYNLAYSESEHTRTYNKNKVKSVRRTSPPNYTEPRVITSYS